MLKPQANSLKGVITSQAGFLLVATVIGYACSYLFLVFMGRRLGPEAFGILGSLVSIFYIACLVGQAIRQAIARNVAVIKVEAGEAAALGTYVRLVAKLGPLCLIPALALIIASGQIASFLHLGSAGPIIFLGLALSAALVLDIIVALLQGLQEFRSLGITSSLVSQGAKLVLGIAFVLAGWDLLGVMGALLAATTIAIATGLTQTRKQLAIGIQTRNHHNPQLGPILLPALVLVVFMALPTSFDVVLVTHYFTANDSGLYNAVATLGKVIIFLPMAVSFVLLPRAAEEHALGRESRKTLLQGLSYALVLSGGVAILYWLLPVTIVELFFGESYLGAGDLSGWYGVTMLLFSLNFVLMHYSLATRKLGLMILASFITLAEAVAIILLHQSLLQVILILFFGNLAIFCCSLPLLLSNRFGASVDKLTGLGT